MDFADVYNKIRAVRVLRGWSQEDAAAKLGIAVNSYAKIERGETDVNLSRLAQIADIMEVGLAQLLEINGHNILNVLESGSHLKCVQQGQTNIILSETECVHELEKSQLLQQQQQREIEHLKKQVAQLEEINGLLKDRVQTRQA